MITMEPDLPDQAVRESIVRDLDVNMLIEAGAGSGKTHSLVERMVALVAGGNCPVKKMAAVTFTRKAAGELRERFQTALESALAGESDPRRKERLAAGLDSLDQCFLGTIHAFCAAVLRERPVEAGLDPGFVELEEIENRLLLENAWHEYLEQAPPERIKELDELDVDVRDLKECYYLLANYPDVEITYDHLPPVDLAPARRRVDEFLNAVRLVLPAQRPAKGWDGLQELFRKMLQFAQTMDLAGDRYLIRLLALCDRNVRCTLNRWPDKEQARTAQSLHEDFRCRTAAPLLQAWREYRYGRLLRFLLPAVAYGEKYRLSRSRLNFQDLLVKTAGLLKNNPEVRCYFQKRYSHLLVDEFQDTDPLQAEIIFYLTGQDVRERDWRRLAPRPGALFVVGDPKQAIYRFRRADIDIYNRVKSLLQRSGGRLLRLTANFRSRPAVVEWVNSTFGKLLPGVDTPCQAAFVTMEPVQNAGGTAGVGKLPLAAITGHRQEDIAAADARRVALWIRRALDGEISLVRSDREREAGLVEKPRPADFMLLLRYKTHLPLYARALESLGIPHIVSGAGGAAGLEDLAAIIKVLRAVAEPDNPLPLVGALRGIFFGISDRQLWQFKKAGGCFNFYRAVPEFAGREFIEHAFNQFRTFRDWVEKLPPLAALEKILETLGAFPLTLAQEAGKSRCSRIIHALELLRASRDRGVYSFAALVEYLALLMEMHSEEELNITPWETDAVRVMNLHRAKGLEAPVVILADPGKNVNREPEMHISRQGDVPRGYFLLGRTWAYRKEILAQPRGWEKYAALEKQYQDAEETRLLYVAATRAKNLLVVSTYPAKPEKSPWRPFEDYLADAAEMMDSGEVPAAEGLSGGATETGPEPAVVAAELTDARRTFLSPVNPVNRPGYGLTSVTELVEAAGKRPAGASGGRGVSWGRAVHRVLEACARGADADAPGLDLLTAAVLVEEGRQKAEKDELIRLVRDILASPLWQRVRRSRKYYVEVPFALSLDGLSLMKDMQAGFTPGPCRKPGGGRSDGCGLPVSSQLLTTSHCRQPGRGEAAANDILLTGGLPARKEVPSAAGGTIENNGRPPVTGFFPAGASPGGPGGINGGAMLLTGVIDLVFLEDNGWVIADYKTGAVDEGRLDTLVRFYTPQVVLYRRCWEQITGDPVQEAGLYFTGLQKWVVIESDGHVF
ncbi:UvrD-helicase domain-containing protein [Desulfotomaculum copahuensis]|nr:UvrD-helicase domain-containing protein [Desulfotomaculum copahuensis]